MSASLADPLAAAPGAGAAAPLWLRPLSEFAPMGGNSADAARLAGWARDFLMRPHAQLGRPGAVCPFVAGAAKLDLIRLGASESSSEAEVLAAMREALAAFEALPCAKAQRHFRAVVVAFPRCAGAQGVATLARVQNRLRPESIFRAKMIGLFEPDSQAAGLLNADFRPLRAPVPALAIRMLVENDAPFVLRNPLLAPIYLAKFPLKGARKLLASLWR